MPLDTALTRRLGLAYPIIQAPLAGGGDTPELVAAVSNAGGIGVIGAAYLSPPQIAETARAVRAKTARPFGINLFAPVAAPARPDDPARGAGARRALLRRASACRLRHCRPRPGSTSRGS